MYITGPFASIVFVNKIITVNKTLGLETDYLCCGRFICKNTSSRVYCFCFISTNSDVEFNIQRLVEIGNDFCYFLHKPRQ